MQRQMMATSVTLGQIQQQLATVADNIANVGTTGYKSRDAKFTDLLFQQIDNMRANADQVDQNNRLTPSGIRDGSGSKVGDTQLDVSLGAIKQTDNPLDLALTNDHQFFTVALTGTNGVTTTAYTRAGAFNAQPDPQNPNVVRLMTKSGNPILGTNGQPIVLPANYRDVHIDNAGAITVELANGTQVNAGQLGLVTVNRPQLLENQGNSLYTLPNLAQLGIGLNQVIQPVAAGNGSVAQGKLENSNVDLTKEMADLINLQHNYQLNARSITIGDQMAGLVNGLLR
ncbi:flagellar hook-basal body protein [Sporolactobacillus laevolacticus]|uniref:flagellar hook-basal body protein n=1 Tax=Sporolactobacillus laevolacticus TaxID=33018 RepID=UPI0025B3A1C1|nr:flagellar hook-basal body protein [Sporolactobacillus laevolacticus]MDN3954703.1 flagellar hook-basal body protein [Sporolactobacillus laevolacticus]